MIIIFWYFTRFSLVFLYHYFDDQTTSVAKFSIFIYETGGYAHCYFDIGWHDHNPIVANSWNSAIAVLGLTFYLFRRMNLNPWY